MAVVRAAVLLVALGVLPGAGPPSLRTADCAPEPSGTRCIYRSPVPSSGIVTSCRGDRDCRVGYYDGDPEAPLWLTPPPDVPVLPKPQVIWHTGSLGEVRFDCGKACEVSYFVELKRRRLSEPRRDVVATDARRLLVALAEGRVLVIRQLFSGREVMRVGRDWAPGTTVSDAVTVAHFDPDGRLTLTWLRGPERTPVTERFSVPSFARN
jgi:hypothetical protein